MRPVVACRPGVSGLWCLLAFDARLPLMRACLQEETRDKAMEEKALLQQENATLQAQLKKVENYIVRRRRRQPTMAFGDFSAARAPLGLAAACARR